MDFLEDLLDFGDRKNRRRDGSYQDDHEDDCDHRQQYPANAYPQAPVNPAVFQPGVVCRKCAAQTVQGAKFCHGCGAAIEMILNCTSCGSRLPANAVFCSQCGFKNG
jgi:ribosomal protein L40E